MKIKNLRSRLGTWVIAVCGAIVLILLPAFVSAETVVRTGDSVTITSGQVVENNLYVMAGSFIHSGEVKADVYAVGGSVTTNGQIGADLTVVGGTVQVHGPVTGDLRVIGGEVIVADSVGGDVFVFGGELKILSSAVVAGNVYFYGGEASIEGEIAGSIMGRAESFKIDTMVASIDVVTDEITLGNKAIINGDIRYQEETKLHRATEAVITGQVLTSQGEETSTSSQLPLIVLIGWFLTSLLLLFLFRNRLDALLNITKTGYVKNGLIGLLVMILMPVVAVMLFFTAIGVWLGVIILVSLILLFLISSVLIPIILGGYLMGFYKKNYKINLLSTLVGVGSVVILFVVPVIGPITLSVIGVIIAGTLSQVTYRNLLTK